MMRTGSGGRGRRGAGGGRLPVIGAGLLAVGLSYAARRRRSRK